MEHGKRPHFKYCIDDITLTKAIGEEGLKRLEKYILCQNAECSRKYPLGTRYLTHPEGKINDKRDERNDLGGMQGDSNKTKHRNRSPSNKKRKSNANHPECVCIGKVIHNDMVAQTDLLFERRNKSIKERNKGINKKKNIYTESKDNDAKEIENFRKIKSKHSKQKRKLDVVCPCPKIGLNEMKTSENIQSNKCSKWLAKPRHRNKNVCPLKVNKENEIDAVIDKDSDICAEGICTEAFNEKRYFVCKKCREKPVSCTPKTCAIYNINEKGQSKSLIDVIKIRSIIATLCNNSKRLLFNKKLLDEPVNAKLIIDKKPECERICFAYKCVTEPNSQKIGLISKIENKKSLKKAQIREIEDDVMDRNVLYPENILTDLNKKCKPCVYKVDTISPLHNTPYIIPSKIKNKKSPKKTVKLDHINELPNDDGDQAGEPILKIEVDPIEKCVLNPDEIKQKLTDLNQKTARKSTCICPSHNKRREQYLSKNLYEGRICQKMFKDKVTNFSCKCENISIDKGGECTDRTCGSSKIIRRKHKKCSARCIQSSKMSEPQLEVKLDAKNMCLLNSEEINRKIAKLKAEANEVCPGGTCAVARCENRNLFNCKCVQKKHEITECSERTCIDEEASVDLMYYWMLKLTNKLNKGSSYKKIRKPLNTIEIAKIKSVVSLICDRLKRTSEIWNGSEATEQTSCALSGLTKIPVHKANYHKRSGLNVPLKKGSPTKKLQSSSKCGCAKVLAKRKKEKGKEEEKEMNNEDKKLDKERRRKEKIQNKILAKQQKEERREMKELSMHDEAGDTNCFTDFLIGVCNLGIGITHCLFYALYKLIAHPKRSYRFIRRCMRYPRTTMQKVRSWFANKWRLQKFHMERSMKGSQTMTILSDEFRESAIYAAFGPKGSTTKEKRILEEKHRRRQQRIRKRTTEALQGCRDILLVTMRKTPCLWVYHLCPDFYPRFLSLRMNFIKFCQMLLFCLAVVVWTPCILCCELCRACVCCLGCGAV